MFVILPVLTLHIVSHLLALLLLHIWRASIPADYVAVLKHLRVSAVLYYYRLANEVSWAYTGVGVVRHWEVSVQQMLGEYLILMQYPAVVLVLVLSAVVGALFRCCVLLYLARVKSAAGMEAVTAGWVRAVVDSIGVLVKLFGLAG